MTQLQRLALLLTFLVPSALAWAKRRSRRPQFHHDVCQALGWGLLILEGADLTVKIFGQPLTLRQSLPMQLCDWALYASAAALLLESQLAFELAYFWGIGGTLQALFTPAVSSDLAWWRLAGFFALHSGILIGVLYLLLTRTFRPVPRSLPRVLLWSEIYFVSALTLDFFAGANYGFLRVRPAAHTLLNAFSSDHRLYLLELNALALLGFALLYAPWFIADCLAPSAEEAT